MRKLSVTIYTDKVNCIHISLAAKTWKKEQNHIVYVQLLFRNNISEENRKTFKSDLPDISFLKVVPKNLLSQIDTLNYQAYMVIYLSVLLGYIKSLEATWNLYFW